MFNPDGVCFVICCEVIDSDETLNLDVSKPRSKVSASSSERGRQRNLQRTTIKHLAALPVVFSAIMNSTRLSSSLFAISRRSLSSVRRCAQFSNTRYITSSPKQLPRAFPLHARYPNTPRYYATMTALKAGDSFPSNVTFS